MKEAEDEENIVITYGFGNEREVATMQLESIPWGYLLIERQSAIDLDHKAHRKNRKLSFDQLAEKFPELVRPVIEWKIVQLAHIGEKYSVSSGMSDLSEQEEFDLAKNKFCIGGVFYDLQWLQGQERLQVLDEVFGLEAG